MSFIEEVSKATGIITAEALQQTVPLLPADTDIKKLDAEIAAEVYRRMLMLANEHRDAFAAAQGSTILWITEDDRWAAHPDQPKTFRDFLRLAELNPSQTTDLNALGVELAPYARHRGIYEDLKYAVKNKWPNFKEAIPALRQAVRDDDTEAFLDILQDVVDAKARNAVREKYRQSRTEPVGSATTVALDDNRTMLIAIIDDNMDVEKVIRRLDGVLTWDLLIDQNDCKIKAETLR